MAKASFLVAAALLTPALAASERDFGGYRRHYQGYGVKTPAGRGGALIHVTNLNNSGEGSLQAALQTEGPRCIVFDVSGTITLTTPIHVTSPFFTLAGQSGPSPGILVRNQPIIIDTHDWVIQHIRLRLGDTTYPGPVPTSAGLYIRNYAYNFVLDHVSMSWSNSTYVTTANTKGPQPQDGSMFECIISEQIKNCPTESGGGFLLYAAPNTTFTFARNLFAHNGVRQPLIGAGNRVSHFNNVVYNAWGVGRDRGEAGMLNLTAMKSYTRSPFEVVSVHNVYIPGPSTHADQTCVKFSLDEAHRTQGNQCYLEANTGPYITGPTGDGQWASTSYPHAGSSADVRIDTIPSWHSDFNYRIIPNVGNAVRDAVLSNAGCRPTERSTEDSGSNDIDACVVASVTAGTQPTRVPVASVAARGGFPSLAENTSVWSDAANPNDVARGETFRTNREVKLETEARALEAFQFIP